MHSTGMRACLLGGLLLTTGCLSPKTTRLPSVVPGYPQVEKRAFERHDPFPDQSAGPETHNRPLGFETQRSVPRRDMEERILQRLRPKFAPPIPRMPAASWKYPALVPH